MNMIKTRRQLLAAAAVAVLPVARLAAEPAKKKKEAPTRTVKGLVSNEASDPLEAVVQLKNTKTLDVRSYHTDAQGRFYFSGLDPNVDYEVRAIAEGMRPKTRRVSSFDDRMELFYEFRLKSE